MQAQAALLIISCCPAAVSLAVHLLVHTLLDKLGDVHPIVKHFVIDRLAHLWLSAGQRYETANTINNT